MTKIPARLEGLQLLIDQFNQADSLEERDEVLTDIIGHDSPEAVQFLRILAEREEDPYTRCDAVCGLFARTGGSEGEAALLTYLAQESEAYQYCRAAETLAEASSSAALPLLWQ